MEGMELVSVIIPNFNGANWIEKTIESCLLQKSFLKEIIVVDDFSTDKSWEIVTKVASFHPNLIFCYRNSVKGGNNARNFGFTKASGMYIQWLDSDDQILPGKLEAQLKEFDRKKDVDIVYSDWYLDTYEENGEIVQREKKQQKAYPDFIEEILKNNWSPPHNYLIRYAFARKLNEINAWNPDTKVGQDREYYSIAALLGAVFSYVQGYFCVYNRWNSSSVSKARQQIVNEALFCISVRLKDLTEKQDRNIGDKMGYYVRLIDTTIVLSCAQNFPLNLNPKPSLFKVEWSMIHGKLTKLKVLCWLMTGKRLAKK